MPYRKTSPKPGSEKRIDRSPPSSIEQLIVNERRRYEMALLRRRAHSGRHNQPDLESLFSTTSRLRRSIQESAGGLALKPNELIDLQTRLHDILDDTLLRAVGSLIDRQVSHVTDQAQRDPVTRLANRSAFDLRLSEQIDRARSGNLSLSIILFDVDQFKRINDRFGHPSGDRVLQEIAVVLEASLRRSDMVFRYGGDEFAAICPATSDQALKLIRPRIDRRLKAHFENSAIPGYTGTSAGAATYPLDGNDAAALIHAADQRLYECKRKRQFSAGAGN